MSPSPTVSRASSAKRSASSRRPWSSSTWARRRWLSTSVPRSWIGLSRRIASRRISSARVQVALAPRRRSRASSACGRASAPRRSRRRSRAPRSSAASASASRPSIAAWRPDARRIQPRVVGLPLVSGELDRARERLVRALGLEPGVVDVVELEQHAALEVGAPDPLRDREPLDREPLDLVEVALPVRRRVPSTSSASNRPTSSARLDDVERPAGELPRAGVVGVAVERHPRERGQRPPLDAAVTRVRAPPRSPRASRPRRSGSRTCARRRGRPGSGARAFGSSSTARENSLRATLFASRASARRPACSSAVGRLGGELLGRRAPRAPPRAAAASSRW